MAYLLSLLMPFYLCMPMIHFFVHLLFLEEACNRLNSFLIHVSNWFKENRLLINSSKSHFMVIGTQSRIKYINETITITHEKPLDKITSTKLLGMIIDENLNFNQHIDYLMKKTYPKIALLNASDIYFILNHSTKYIMQQFNHILTIASQYGKTHQSKTYQVSKSSKAMLPVLSRVTMISQLLYLVSSNSYLE